MSMTINLFAGNAFVDSYDVRSNEQAEFSNDLDNIRKLLPERLQKHFHVLYEYELDEFDIDSLECVSCEDYELIERITTDYWDSL